MKINNFDKYIQTMKPHTSALGRHILVEFYRCNPEILNRVVEIEEAMVNAAEESGATIINSSFHHFSPYGVSGVVVIQESHLAIHTWPEYQYAAVDLFTCGDTVNPWISYDSLKQAFEAGHGSAIELKRGQLELLEKTEIDVSDLRDEHTKKLSSRRQTRNVWFTDRDENTALSIRHKGDLLFNKKSPYQMVQVYDTYKYGKTLAIDHMVMCTEKDEFIYHEMIAHPTALAANQPKDVLVIGAGDGGTVRELLKHESIANITVVEIDEVVVNASKEFFPEMAAAFDDSRCNLIIGDGINHLANTTAESYDLILVDGSDPKGPAEGLFNRSFFENVYRCLKPNGILGGQCESPQFNQEAFVALFTMFFEIFGRKNVKPYLAYIPTYPSGMWSFCLCQKGSFRAIEMDRVSSFCAEQQLKYYNEEIHYSSFALPNYVKQMLP